MEKKKSYVDAIIDKLTNSIENAFTGDVFDTEILLLTTKHYQDSLGAKLFRGTRMYLDSREAIKLINQYFKNK
jgi:hypothetical protein